MLKFILSLTFCASLSFAQPWQWDLVEPDWKNPTGFPQLSPSEFPVCIADVTGDGLADVMQFGVSVYLSVQQPNGQWTDVPTAGGPQMTTNEKFTASNLDTDAAFELVVTSLFEVSCYKLNQEDEPWSWELRNDLIEDRIPTHMDSVYAITWGNFDQDANEEAAVLLQIDVYAAGLFIYEREDAGDEWTSQVEFTLPFIMRPLHMYSGDFDHDGDTDLAVELFMPVEFVGQIFFENTDTGIQTHDFEYDREMVGPGGGDLDGDGEWEFLYLNSCFDWPTEHIDGPFAMEMTDWNEYSFVKNLREVSRVIGRLREPNGSFVAGVSSTLCNSPWGGGGGVRTDFINLDFDNRPFWSIEGIAAGDFSRGDMNADGRDDLLGQYYIPYGGGLFDPQWTVLINVGDVFIDQFERVQGLHFDPNGVDFPEEYSNPSLCDVDGDHRAELIVSPTNSFEIGTIQIFAIEQLAPDEILLRAEALESGLPDSVSSFEVVDLDGDGLTEILPVVNGTRYAYFFRSGLWETYDAILPNITSPIRGFADWNDDGTTDIFAEEGIFLNLTPSTTDEQATFHPYSFTLSAYPNPFNAQTTISFNLPRAGNVSLKLYDLLGREVESLVDQPMTAGAHTLNYSASHLASGVYFARLESGDLNATHKLLLLR